MEGKTEVGHWSTIESPFRLPLRMDQSQVHLAKKVGHVRPHLFESKTETTINTNKKEERDKLEWRDDERKSAE